MTPILVAPRLWDLGTWTPCDWPDESETWQDGNLLYSSRSNPRCLRCVTDLLAFLQSCPLFNHWPSRPVHDMSWRGPSYHAHVDVASCYWHHDGQNDDQWQVVWASTYPTSIAPCPWAIAHPRSDIYGSPDHKALTHEPVPNLVPTEAGHVYVFSNRRYEHAVPRSLAMACSRLEQPNRYFCRVILPWESIHGK